MRTQRERFSLRRGQNTGQPFRDGPDDRVVSVIAFHEKAGRSQVNSCFILFDTLFLFRPLAAVAMLPSALSRSDGFARCMLGVLGSAGAAICLAPCRFTEVERGPGD